MTDLNSGATINPLKEHTISSRLCSANYLCSGLICVQFYSFGAVYKGRPANWEGGGFEISDIPGRGEGGGWFVKVRTSENF